MRCGAESLRSNLTPGNGAPKERYRDGSGHSLFNPPPTLTSLLPNSTINLNLSESGSNPSQPISSYFFIDRMNSLLQAMDRMNGVQARSSKVKCQLSYP